MRRVLTTSFIAVTLAVGVSACATTEGTPTTPSPGIPVPQVSQTTPTKPTDPLLKGTTYFTPLPEVKNPQLVKDFTWRELGSNRLAIFFTSGIQPCTEITVKTTETNKTVAVDLRTGSNPANNENTACPAIAVFASTVVELKAPRGGKVVVNGEGAVVKEGLPPLNFETTDGM